MEEATARIILFAVSGVGVVVWAAGLRFVQAAYRARATEQRLAAEQFELDGPPPQNCVFGSAEVEGEPAALAARAAAVLAQQGTPPTGQVKILRRTDREVAFEGAGPGSEGTHGGQIIRRGQLQFTPLGSARTRIDYAVEVAGGRGLLVGGVVCVVLGAAALIAGFVTMNILVVPNPNPAVRGQTLQMLQISHFLWPPFLFGALYRRRYTVVRAHFDTLIHNLPYLADEAPGPGR